MATTTKKTTNKRKKSKSSKKKVQSGKNNFSFVGIYLFLIFSILIIGSVVFYTTFIFPKALSQQIISEIIQIYQPTSYENDNDKMIVFRLDKVPDKKQQELFAQTISTRYSLSTSFQKIADIDGKGINKICFSKNDKKYNSIKDIYIYWNKNNQTHISNNVEQKNNKSKHSIVTTTTTNKTKDIEKNRQQERDVAIDSKLKEQNEIKTFEQRKKNINKKIEQPDIKVEKMVVAPTPTKQTFIPKGFVTIIIDDIGYAYESTDEFLSIGVPITFAIIPETPHAMKYYQLITQHSYESIIHIPMEPEKGKDFVEKNALLTEMSDVEITTNLQRFFMEMPECVGANNHMGSKAIADGTLMNSLIGYLAQNNKLWVDSMTNLNSLSREFGAIYKIPDLHRDVFLDNQKDEASLCKAMDLLIREAKKNGYAIGIGHAQSDLLPQVIKKYYSHRREYDVEFITLKQHLNKD